MAQRKYYLFGNEFRNKSLVFVFNFSGKTISKEISMSPLLKGSLDSGKPFPAIRLTVVGLTISSNRLTTNRSPFNVGTSTLVPHNAWKTKKINIAIWCAIRQIICVQTKICEYLFIWIVQCNLKILKEKIARPQETSDARCERWLIC